MEVIENHSLDVIHSIQCHRGHTNVGPESHRGQDRTQPESLHILFINCKVNINIIFVQLHSFWLRRWIDELPLRFEGMVRSVSLNDVPASSSGEPRDGVIHGFGFRSSAWSSPGGWIGGEVC